MRFSLLTFFSVLLSFFCATNAFSADYEEPNYDESKVPEYVLPDPLTADDGTRITTAEEWVQKRRPELLETFRREMYGRWPSADLSKVKFEELTSIPDALNGKATRKEIRVYFDAPNPLPKVDLMVFIPNERQGAAPVFLMPNFKGNFATTDDPTVGVTIVPGAIHGDATRGCTKSRWPFEKIVDRGYAVATCFYEEIDPDFNDGYKNGVHPLFADDPNASDYPSSISAWAWGLSRCLDCLETLPEIDAKKAIVLGHSRLGKTALWCGVNDERFAAVVSNDSGCCGASLTKRQFGENLDFITTVVPHWSCGNFKKYARDIDNMPFDQHELIALIAPRPVYVASAEEDLWADPKGEFLAAYYADPVYKLLGTEGIGEVDAPPATDQPVGKTIRYHRRSGDHDVTDYDWEQYCNFADEIFKK